MHYSYLFLAAAATIVGAQDFSSDDYPSSCGLHCDPIVSFSSTCDSQFDDDAQQLDCLCQGPNMASSILFCEECVSNYTSTATGDDDDYNEIDELREACGFPPPLGGGSSDTTTTPSAVVTSSTISSTSNSTTVSSTTTSSSSTSSTVSLTTITGSPSSSSSMSMSSSSSTSSDDDDTSTTTTAITPASASSDGVASGNIAIATMAPMFGAGAAAILAAVAAV